MKGNGDMDFLGFRTLQISVDNKIIGMRRIIQGTPQDSPLSLFTIYMLAVVRKSERRVTENTRYLGT